MEKLKRHWTEKRVVSFVHRIAFDFVTQIQKRMEESPIRKKDLARKLGVTPSAVSQVLNTPRNLTLSKAVEYGRAVGLKVALIAYDDGDPSNQNGPINSEIFEQCWRLQGAPVDFFELATVTIPTCRVSMFHAITATNDPWKTIPLSAQQPLSSEAVTQFFASA